MSTPGQRKRGRPRAFEDEQIFQIISELLLNGSLADVTLERVAKLAGTTNQAISQRFSSKAGLLIAHTNWMTSIARADIDAIRRSSVSPLQKFKSIMLLPINPRVLPNPSSSPLESWTPILMEVNRDPILAEIHTRERHHHQRVAIELITEAQQAGELRPVEPNRILELVSAVLMGATKLWEWDQSEDILVKMRRCMNSVLELFAIDEERS